MLVEAWHDASNLALLAFKTTGFFVSVILGWWVGCLLVHVSVILGLWSSSLWVLYVCNDGLVGWIFTVSCSSKSGFMDFESVGLGGFVDISYGRCNLGGYGYPF